MNSIKRVLKNPISGHIGVVDLLKQTFYNVLKQREQFFVITGGQ